MWREGTARACWTFDGVLQHLRTTSREPVPVRSFVEQLILAYYGEDATVPAELPRRER